MRKKEKSNSSGKDVKWLNYGSSFASLLSFSNILSKIRMSFYGSLHHFDSFLYSDPGTRYREVTSSISHGSSWSLMQMNSWNSKLATTSGDLRRIGSISNFSPSVHSVDDSRPRTLLTLSRELFQLLLIKASAVQRSWPSGSERKKDTLEWTK